MNVRYADEVRDDLLSSMTWYDERRCGLGDELETEFHAAVAAIRDRPKSFAADETGFRPCRIRRFNAVIYYTIEVNTIVVLGLLVNGRHVSTLDRRRHTGQPRDSDFTD